MTSAAQSRLTAGLYVVLGLQVMVAPLATSFYLPGLPELATDLGGSIAEAQLTVSSALVGLAVGQFFLGSISDRYGRRRPLLIGMGLFVLTSILCALAPNLTVLVILRFLQGLAGAAGPVIARASIRDMASGREAAQGLSRLLFIAGMAPVVGPLIGGLILLVMDWRGLFLALAVVAGVALAVAVRWFPETLPRERRLGGSRGGQRAAMAMVLRDRTVVTFLLVTASLGIVSFGFSSTSPFYFIEGFGLSPQQYAAIVAANSLAFVGGAYVNTRAVGVTGPRRALARGLTLMCLTTSVILVTTLIGTGVWWPLVFTVLTMGAYGGMIANSQALALNSHAAVAGTVSALLGTAQFIGGAVVPPLVTPVLGPMIALPVLLVGASAVALALTVTSKGARSGRWERPSAGAV